MITELKLLGVRNDPVDLGGGVKLSRWIYQYFAEAANGLVDIIDDEDYVEDGTYDIPYFDFKEDSEDEDDLLGSTVTRCEGPATKREVCEIAAFCWA